MDPPPRRWLVLTVESPSEAWTPALAEGLVALGGSAVEQRGLTLETYLPAPADERGAAELAEGARSTFATLIDGTAPPVRWSWRDDEDWAARWREGLGPRRIGRRLVVTPSWTLDRAACGPEDLLIVIDPQMAFGTGEHASTRGVLRLMEKVVRPGAVVLDIGTGSGILAMAAVRLGAAAVDAVDCDPDALRNARENVEINHLNGIHFEQCIADADDLRARGGDRYDVIVANVLSGVLRPLLGAMRDTLCRGGTIVLGGILETESHEMIDAARAEGLRVCAENTEEGWWSGALRG